MHINLEKKMKYEQYDNWIVESLKKTLNGDMNAYYICVYIYIYAYTMDLCFEIRKKRVDFLPTKIFYNLTSGFPGNLLVFKTLHKIISNDFLNIEQIYFWNC